MVAGARVLGVTAWVAVLIGQVREIWMQRAVALTAPAVMVAIARRVVGSPGWIVQVLRHAMPVRVGVPAGVISADRVPAPVAEAGGAVPGCPGAVVVAWAVEAVAAAAVVDPEHPLISAEKIQ